MNAILVDVGLPGQGTSVEGGTGYDKNLSSSGPGDGGDRSLALPLS